MFSLYIGVDQGPSDPTANDLPVCHLFPSCRQFLDRPWTYKISDKISTKSLLEKHKMLSVNQLNAQIKTNDMWKATHLSNYPTKVTPVNTLENAPNTRIRSNGNLKEVGKTNIMQSTFLNDATRAWNLAFKV